ncbi:MAG: DNA cytosine methyltransferase [Cenarchaeum symbiont of Oopsacas minuta]|nr:DNA cytosine methyltransferase [Cenarchaeum symbiont of Oopsacas minuta]
MNKIKKPYSLATLFSGAGGLDSGFVKSGKFKSRFANDVLTPPALTYSKNHDKHIQNVSDFNMKPKFPCYIVGDVTKINFGLLKKIDCVIGGPPCQDFSITRKNRNSLGVKMARGRLYSHFIRILKKTRPRVFIFENVPGLKSVNNGNAYNIICKDLQNLNNRWSKNMIDDNATNYHLIFNNIIDSSHIGVPQRRKRLIIIGVRKDRIRWLKDRHLMDKIENTMQDKKSLLKKYPITAMEAFEGKTIPELADKYKETMESYNDIIKYVDTNYSRMWIKNIFNNITFNVVKDYLFFNNIKFRDDSEIDQAFKTHKKILKELGYYKKSLKNRKFKDGSNKIPVESEHIRERMMHIPPDMNHLFVENTKWNVNGTMSNIYRRICPLKPAYTVLAYGGGGTWGYHYEKERGMMTNRERARLQTFSDDYEFQGNVSQIRAQIGEAVPVRLGQKLSEIAEYILKQTQRK